MSNEFGNGIRKKIEAVDKNERNLFKVKEEAKAQCTHTLHGEPAFIPSNEPRTEGSLKYICKLCKKHISITSIQEEELQKACNVLDQAIDIIKITIGGLNNDVDNDVLRKIAKTQYRVRNELMPAYRAAIKKGNRHNKRHNHNDNNGGSWGRPQIAGR